MGVFLKETRLTRQSSGDGPTEHGERDSQSGLWEHFGSFVRGIGSVLVLFPPPPVVRRRTGEDSIQTDWQKVEGDLNRAIERVLSDPEGGRD